MDGGDENDFDFDFEIEIEREKDEDFEIERVKDEDDEEEEADPETEVLKDRFRLSVVSIAEVEAKRSNMEVSQPVMACISDLAFQFTEQLAKDLELFAQHASRKSVNMEDVILSAHRNEHLATLLRSFSQELKGKEPQSDKKRKKAASKKEEIATSNILHIS